MKQQAQAMNRLALLLTLALAACGGTETDNPLSTDGEEEEEDPPPMYESTIGLSDPRSAPPGCVGRDYDGRPAKLPLADLAGTDLLATDDRGHLLWADVRDPTRPVVKARLPLAGRPRQLIAAPGPAATVVMVAFDTKPDTDGSSPSDVEPQTRLVRVESEGDRLQQVAEVTLRGEFWRMTLAAGDAIYWVMAARERDPIPYCDVNPYGCGGGAREALLITGYRYADGQFHQVQAVELPMTYRAWASKHGYATDVASETGGPATIHYVRFLENHRLGEPGQVVVPGSPSAAAGVDLQRGQLRTFVRSQDSSGTFLIVHDLSQRPTAPVSSTPMPQETVGMSFVNGGAYPRAYYRGDDIFLQGPGGWHIDVRDPTAPVLTRLATELLGLWPVRDPGSEPTTEGTEPRGAEALVALQADDTGALALSLWQRDAEGVVAGPSVILPVMADGARTAVGARLAQQDDILWLFAPSPQRNRYLHGLRLAGGGLELLASEPVGFSTEELLATTDALLGVGHDRITLHEPLPEPGARGVSAEFLPLEPEGHSWQSAVGDDFTASVHRVPGRADHSEPWLHVTRGQAVETLKLAYPPDTLLATDGHVLAINTAPRSECQQAGLACGDYVPSVRVFGADGPLSLVGEVPLPQSPLAQRDQGQAELSWQLGEGQPRLRLPDGRFVFPAHLSASCNQPEQCEALGIDNAVPIEEAPVATASCVESGPNGQPNMCPPPATVYGSIRELRLYALDHRAMPPAFTLLGASRLDSQHGRFGPARVVDGALLVTRIERAEPAFGTAMPVARAVLDMFALEPAGEASAQTPINVPGYPLSVTTSLEHLLSAERTDAGLVLYRSELGDGSARVLQQHTLPGATFDSAANDGSRLFLVTHSGQGCDAETHLHSLDPAEELSPGAPLALRGDQVRVADLRGDRLLLSGREAWLGLVSLERPDRPELERTLVPATPIYTPLLTPEGNLPE